VVSGIGFLGAGAMIRLGNNIRGLTTAASLWLIAAVGLAIGAGMFAAAAVTEALTLLALVVLGIVEKRLFPSERNKLLELSYKDNNPDIKEVLKILREYGVRVQSMDVDQGRGKGKGARLRLFTGIPNTVDIAKLARALKSAGKAERVEMKEKY
jgi:putative Mg2+ transporter-C (MgtC) family protein